MGSVPPLLSFLLMIAAGWVHRHQLIVIEFLQAENRLLKDRLGGRRIRFTDAERALLARKGKAVGRGTVMASKTISANVRARRISAGRGVRRRALPLVLPVGLSRTSSTASKSVRCATCSSLDETLRRQCDLRDSCGDGCEIIRAQRCRRARPQ